MMIGVLPKVWHMDYSTAKSSLSQKRANFQKDWGSLKDVPLEVRRKEAEKPLFLTRYE
jgi:hypothetical protein